MAPRSNELPSIGFALEIDGRIKTEFDTREGAESGAIALKRRFPELQVRVHDASTKSPARGAGLTISVPSLVSQCVDN
jgi:hypothetical protein